MSGEAQAGKSGVERKLPGWRELTPGGVITYPGNAREFITGDWGVVRPEWHEQYCIQCLFCWVGCPDNAVEVESGKVVGFDYAHCKGCGVCAHQCPGKVVEGERRKAIEMKAEADFAKQDRGKV
ncbi:MAG: 4Fe-4S dicluster domain-containing protein [Betaproteobacteria bacterium]